MKRLFNKVLDRTYSAPIGAAGCLILFYIIQVEKLWIISLRYFVLTFLILIYVCTTTAIIEFLTNKNYFEENKREKRNFKIFHILIISIFCAIFAMFYIVAL